MPVLLNGGLELPGPEPSFSFGAARTTTSPHEGSYCAELPKDAGQLTAGRVQWTLDEMTVGVTYDVACYVKRPAGPGGIRCRYDPGDGSTNILATKSSGSGAWALWEVGSFVALGTTGWLRFDSLITDDGKSWFMDEVTFTGVGSAVAVKLSERAVDAVVSLLQANLATELTAIDTDRADGVTMAAPANAQYYKRPKSEVAGATVHVEVYEGSFDFTNPYTDADAERAVYDLPLDVRVTFFNRDQDTADTMMIRMRRYATAVFNVINKNPSLADSDNATQHIVVTGVRPYWEVDSEDEDKVVRVRTTVSLTVACEEVQA